LACPAGDMLVKVVLLALWLALVEAWLFKHFHSSLEIDDILILIGLPFGSVWFTTLFDYLVDEDSQKSMKGRFKGMVMRLLNFRVIAMLYLIAFTATMVFATVSITPAKEIRQRTLSLIPLGGTKASASAQTSLEKTVDLHLFINPFAIEYELTVTGYVPRVISVLPVVGTKIVPDRHLVRLPTVLFRPSRKGSELLASRGWFYLYRKVDDQFVKLAEDQGNRAWYTGPRRQQSNDLRNEWRLEAAAEKVDPTSLARMMLRWRNPKELGLERDIAENDVVCALITNIDKKILSGAVEIIGAEEYVDISLGELGNDLPNTADTGDAVCRGLYAGAS